ncbi:MAG TPA: MFS transporter [Thermoanaerobaculia bacterium]|jgi:MFS family permease|nr:MFS transporter [Thermoanaerobaculia bacterium]
MTTAALSRLRSWLGLERNIAAMLAMFLVLGMGEELWSRFIPKYLEMLGAGAWAVALYGTLKDLLDAVYPYPGGWLADRVGRRSSLMLFAGLAIGGYALYMVAPSWPWLLAGTVLVMAWSSLTLPAIFAVIGDHLPPTRRAMGFGVQSTLKRVPIILAPPLGGALIASLGLAGGIRTGLAVTVLLALLGIAILRRSYVESAPPPPDPERLGGLWRGMDPDLKRLLLADVLARWAEGIPKVFILLFVIDVLGGTAVEFGGLTSVQMIAATLVYLPVARLSDRMNRKPFVLLTFAFFALFPLALALSRGTLWLTIAFIVAGLRETGEPARKALIVDLASAGARGRAVGLYYLIRGLAVFPASLVGGWLWTIDRRLPFYAAFAVGVAGFLVHALWGPGDVQR